MQSPALYGRAVRIEFRGNLTVHRGQLLSAQAKGTAVHAGSYLRQHLIVLDTALLADWQELNRILVHELFHFAWVRLGNPKRRSYGSLLGVEYAAKARGELGWSAEWRKNELTNHDFQACTRRWRDYTVESFCDTAAHLYSGCQEHEEYTLAARWKKQRARWFQGIFEGSGVLI